MTSKLPTYQIPDRNLALELVRVTESVAMAAGPWVGRGEKNLADGAAVEAIVDTIVRAVHSGESVTITGFGVFEQRKRAARVARNPRTGETVKVKPTSVPAFRPGAQFKAVISGSAKGGRVTNPASTSPPARSPSHTTSGALAAASAIIRTHRYATGFFANPSRARLP